MTNLLTRSIEDSPLIASKAHGLRCRTHAGEVRNHSCRRSAYGISWVVFRIRLCAWIMLNRIGPYSIIREIAEDTLGRVFEAVDPARKKHVIIKSLRPETASRPEVLSRLYSEAKTLALLNHPHIARIFGFIRANDNIYLVMELVEGESLQSILKEKGRLDPNLVLAIFHQIMTAVKYAHDLGVVHGDLKPSNVMVASFAQIKILNFAIAPILGDLDIHHHGSDSAPYMAPERIARQPVDARSDIYSLGALFYEAIVGRVPFTGNDQEEVRRDAGTSTPLPPSLLISDCPVWLDGFLLRALAAAREDRFRSVAAMAQAMGADAPGRVRGIAPKGVAGATPPGRIQRIGSMRSNLRDVAKSKLRAPELSLRRVKEGLRRQQAGVSKSLRDAAGAFRRSVTALQPSNWIRPAALKIQPWTRGIQSRGRFVSAPEVTITAGPASSTAAMSAGMPPRARRLKSCTAASAEDAS